MQLERVYGVNLKVPSLHFLSQSTLLYLSGTTVVIQDINTHAQKFITKTETCLEITGIAVDFKKNEVAIAEKRSNDNPVIVLYNLMTLRKGKKSLTLTNETLSSKQSSFEASESFILKSLNYSKDFEFILAIGEKLLGGISTKQHLLVWKCKTCKICAVVKLMTNGPNNILTKQSVSTSLASSASFSALPMKIATTNDEKSKRKTDSKFVSAHQIIITGNDFLKVYKLHENSLKLLTVHVKAKSTLTRVKSHKYTTHCWLTSNVFVVGTGTSQMLLFRNNELLGLLNDDHTSDMEELTVVMALLVEDQATWEQVLNGFVACSNKINNFHLLEESEGKQISLESFSSTYVSPFADHRETNKKNEFNPLQNAKIKFAAISPENDVIALASSTNDIFLYNLSTSNMLQNEEHSLKRINGFHVKGSPPKSAYNDLESSTVTNDQSVCMAFATRQNNLYTASADNSLQRYDFSRYKESNGMNEKYFREKVLTLSVDTTGYYIIISFIKQVELHEILLKDFRLQRIIDIRQCDLLKFSKSGHLFAAFNPQMRIISVFMTCDEAVQVNLKPFLQKPLSISFCNQDRDLISCAPDGKVICFNVLNSKIKARHKFPPGQEMIKVIDIQQMSTSATTLQHFLALKKTSTFTDQVVTLSLFESEEIFEDLHCMTKILNLISSKLENKQGLVHEMSDVFASSSNYAFDEDKSTGNIIIKLIVCVNPSKEEQKPFLGYIFSLAAQFTVKANGSLNFQSLLNIGIVNENYNKVESIFICEKNFNCSIVSTDGTSLSLYRCEADTSTEPQEKSLVKESNENVYSESLIPKSTVQKKKALLEEKQNFLKDLITQNNGKLRQMQKDFNTNFSNLNAEHENKVIELKTAMKKVESEIETQKKNCKMELKSFEELKIEKLTKLEEIFLRRKSKEEKKHIKIEDQTEKRMQKWELQKIKQNIAQEEHHQKIVTTYENKITNTTETHLAFERKLNLVTQKLANYQFDMERENDQKLFAMRSENANSLNVEKLTSHSQKKINQDLNQTLSILRETESKLKEDMNSQIEEERLIKEKLRSLEKDKCGQKNEITEREETIAEKEELIFELKRKNQELEKFRFVLDYKMKELKKEIEPQKLELKEKKQQIYCMEKELKCYQTNNFKLDQMVTELRLKKKGMSNELMRKKNILNNLIHRSQLISNSLQKIKSNHDDSNDFKDLKNGVVNLSKLFLTNENKENLTKNSYETVESKCFDNEVVDETLRRRIFLENSINSLVKKMEMEKRKNHEELKKLNSESQTLKTQIN